MSALKTNSIMLLRETAAVYCKSCRNCKFTLSTGLQKVENVNSQSLGSGLSSEPLEYEAAALKINHKIKIQPALTEL
jgi:hypothetical protein